MKKTIILIFYYIFRHVDDVDLFPAGIAERPVEGGLIGTTFACIIGRQFRDLRSGDRLWYENNGANRFTPGQLCQGNIIFKLSSNDVMFQDTYPSSILTGILCRCYHYYCQYQHCCYY